MPNTIFCKKTHFLETVPQPLGSNLQPLQERKEEEEDGMIRRVCRKNKMDSHNCLSTIDNDEQNEIQSKVSLSEYQENSSMDLKARKNCLEETQNQIEKLFIF